MRTKRQEADRVIKNVLQEDQRGYRNNKLRSEEEQIIDAAPTKQHEEEE